MLSLFALTPIAAQAQSISYTEQKTGISQNADGTIFGFYFSGLVSVKFYPDYSKGGGNIWWYYPGPTLLKDGQPSTNTCAANFSIGSHAVSLNNPGISFTVQWYYQPDSNSPIKAYPIASDVVPASLVVPNGSAARGYTWSPFDGSHFPGVQYQIVAGVGIGTTATTSGM